MTRGKTDKTTKQLTHTVIPVYGGLIRTRLILLHTPTSPMFHSTGFRPWVLVVRRMLTLRTTYVRHKKKLLPATARDKSWQKWLKVLLHKEKTFYLTRVLKVPLTSDILYIRRLYHTKELLEHVLNKKFSLNDAVSSVILLYELLEEEFLYHS